jgi:hypothetical protein
MIKFFNYFFEGEEKKKMKLADNEKVLLPLFFTMAYNTVLVGEANCLT